MVTDAIASGRQALMSLRRPTWFVPQSFFGTPRGDLTFAAHFPGGSGDELNHMMVKMVVGEPKSYGFPQPDDEDWTATPPTFSTLVPYWASAGGLGVPQIARFAGDTVYFVDGTSAEVDTVIWATGYDAPVPFVPEGLLTYMAVCRPGKWAGSCRPTSTTSISRACAARAAARPTTTAGRRDAREARASPARGI